MRCIMADMLTDLLIYIAIGIMTFSIGAILGYQILSCTIRSGSW